MLPRWSLLTICLLAVHFCMAFNQEENVLLHLESHEHLKSTYRQETLLKLMATLMTNLLKNQPGYVQFEAETCVQYVQTVESYAHCMVPVVKRHRETTIQQNSVHDRIKIMKLKKRSDDNGRKKFHLRKKKSISTFPTTTTVASKMAVDFTMPPVGSVEILRVIEKPVFQTVGELALDVAKWLKHNTGGSWLKFPNVDNLLKDKNMTLDDQVTRPLEETKIQNPLLQPQLSNLRQTLNRFLDSPLVMMKEDYSITEDSGTPSTTFKNGNNPLVPLDLSQDDGTFDFLSPRFMPIMEKMNQVNSFLSPDILSLYEGGSNSILSMPEIMSHLSHDERRPWLEFIGEISGTNDIFRFVETLDFAKLLKLSKIKFSEDTYFSVDKMFDVLNNTLVDVFKMMTFDQLDNLNSKGYTFMNGTQLDKIYGSKKSSLKFDVDEFLNLSEVQKDYVLLEEILDMAQPRRRRVKRANSPPIILSPYIGGTSLVTYLLAPSVLSPSVFSYIILGPLVLSPYILSPYVFGPFILSPQVLTPFVLSPYVLSPDILNPIVLSPGILSPTVLAPYILSPFVLSPAILSPAVLSPTVLSPGVLGPGILSPVVLGPSILSPSVMNPTVFSPTVYSPSILSPGVLNPSIMSPGFKSPSILSPCAMCKKYRRKRRILYKRKDSK